MYNISHKHILKISKTSNHLKASENTDLKPKISLANRKIKWRPCQQADNRLTRHSEVFLNEFLRKFYSFMSKSAKLGKIQEALLPFSKVVFFFF